MAAFEEQHRPVRRAFCLFCAALTCLLLLISALSTPSTASAASKVLRYSTQKAAGCPSAFADIECRKRAVTGKVTPLDGSDIDGALPPAGTDLRLHGAAVIPIIMSPSGFGSGREETRGARAPPGNFA